MFEEEVLRHAGVESGVSEGRGFLDDTRDDVLLGSAVQSGEPELSFFPPIVENCVEFGSVPHS